MSSLAENAIALLIELAEQGEINPWDVQVIEVIDRFLSKLQPVPSTVNGRAPYEADLSQSGQAFLYAAMLLLLKADSLARSEEAPEAEVAIEDGLEANDWKLAALPPNLEQKIRRRAAAPPVSNRRVTLNELIAQLNLIAATMSEDRLDRARSHRPRPQPKSQAIRAIAQLAHQENLSEVAAALEQFLKDHWEDLSQADEWLEFEQLLAQWVSKTQPASPKTAAPIDSSHAVEAPTTAHDRVGVFWALLFLSSQSKVELWQDQFYQDLKVRSLTHVTPEAAAEIATSQLD